MARPSYFPIIPMTQSSSTQQVPVVSTVPNHIAIIMDGNGRWATKRFLPRVAGHAKGVETVRSIVEACIDRGVGFLTLFAFSSENWRRPADEVSLLMRLFITALDREVSRMHANGIRLKVVGDLSRFETKLQDMISQAERKTAANKRLTVTICANYGGRWDIMQGDRQNGSRSIPVQQRSAKISWRHIWPWLTRRSRICSFAPAASSVFLIFSCGNLRIQNCILLRLSGLISIRKNWMMRSPLISSASAASDAPANSCLKRQRLPDA